MFELPVSVSGRPGWSNAQAGHWISQALVTFKRMVERQQRLDLVYRALADSTRRSLLTALRSGDARIKDLADPFPMSFAAVARHVATLERAQPDLAPGPRPGTLDLDHRRRATGSGGMDRPAVGCLVLPCRRPVGLSPTGVRHDDGTQLPSARVERVLPARPETVYDAWLDERSLKEFICPAPGHATEVAVDARIGGR